MAYVIKIVEHATATPAYFEFGTEKVARKALPDLKKGCRVGEGRFALYDYDPRVVEGGPALVAGVRK